MDRLCLQIARRARGCVLLALGLAGCASAKPYSGPVPQPSTAEFQTNVYPMLLRNCAFSNCHGDEHRFFRVLGPGRTRLDPKQMPSDPATPDEIGYSYDRARSMLVTGSTLSDSLLLRKPLAESEGGEGHRGVDNAGRNVFASKNDPDYVMLRNWALGEGPAQSASGSGGAAGKR